MGHHADAREDGARHRRPQREQRRRWAGQKVCPQGHAPSQTHNETVEEERRSADAKEPRNSRFSFTKSLFPQIKEHAQQSVNRSLGLKIVFMPCGSHLF